jgi:hypothetical protein
MLRERAMVVATLPAEDSEPEGDSRLWLLGVLGAAYKANRARDPAERRDRVLLLAAYVMGWLEAVDDLLDPTQQEPRCDPE